MKTLISEYFFFFERGKELSDYSQEENESKDFRERLSESGMR